MIEGGENSLRLSFAPVPADRAAEGVARIASALERSLQRLLTARMLRPALIADPGIDPALPSLA